MVSIPFIAGQWSLRGAPEASSQRFGEVSIPFIAGQWSLPPAQTRRLISPRRFQSPSLRGSGRFGARRRRGAPGPPRFQSPSLRGSGRFTPPGASTSPRSSSFNPLHCGAVVASEAPPGPRNRGGPFQSPSLRGSGRFRRRTAEPGGRAGFQSPSLRGSGRFKWKPCFLQWRRSCFNPLHCGAVVASTPDLGGDRAVSASFNPLHCGAVVASTRAVRAAQVAAAVFQSPSLRGSGRFRISHRRCQARRRVSIPFIAGQWSLL